ncbi:MAG: hypothetical protein WCP18_01840 [bacterium]
MEEQNFINKLEENIAYGRTNEHLLKDDLKKLLEENLKYSQAIYYDTQKVRRYMFWQFLISLFWFILIVAPIIAAAIWLPPFLKNYYQDYQSIIGKGQGSMDLINQLKKIN